MRPRILQVAVGPVACEVAGAVQLARPAAAERVGHEALGRQLGAVQVAAREAGAADIQLARHADRHGFPVVVEDVQPAQIGDRDADHAARAGSRSLRAIGR